MATLILVRHGQAVADRLTELGRRQAAALAEHWLGAGVELDGAFHGSLERQRETAAIVADGYARAGRRFPEPRLEPGLDEYPAEGIVERLGPRLAERDATFAELRQAWLGGGPPEQANARFQRMFEPLMQDWQQGELADPAVETWTAFAQRVRGALGRLTQGRGVTIAAFTSGGPIGTVIQTALGAPDDAALELNWRVRNASQTTLLFSRGRVTLDGFNDTASLPRELVSFR